MASIGLPRDGKVALLSFIAYFTLTLTLTGRQSLESIWNFSTSLFFLALGLSVTFITPHSGVAKRAGFLGSVFGISVVLIVNSSILRYLGWYLASLSFFHFSEYMMVSIYNPRTLSMDSFLLNHSPEYKIAAVASWMEFAIERLLFPGLKGYFLISFVGIVFMIGGDFVRKLAMITAKSNFTHLVRYHRVDEHVLVTGGIYAWCRHPAYVGWFFWSIGTQMTLCNPICFVGYAYASWKFFKERIFEEEILLLQFFEQEYVKYQKKVGTGLPFIKGCILDDFAKDK
ncbi:predicted protein [Nematostella vectensis]|uniref:Protein-S-isoprenylcysteine O-methyltransferase n=1 Tax=Nematostella vectensis TaxID=45351 RepID=A7RLB3_NEMVE|nr:predicted protein [Nematostella vectensis]|eukprot:XP_001639966.1 predicted protein [Nematostella vectensis]